MHLRDVTDHAHTPSLSLQTRQSPHDVLQGLLVQGAEPLVDEEGLQSYSPGVGLDHFGQSQGHRQGGHERLAAGERGGGPLLVAVLVGDLQLQALKSPAALGVVVEQPVPALGHDLQVTGRGLGHPFQPSGQHKGGQRHAQAVVGAPPVERVGQFAAADLLGQLLLAPPLTFLEPMQALAEVVQPVVETVQRSDGLLVLLSCGLGDGESLLESLWFRGLLPCLRTTPARRDIIHLRLLLKPHLGTVPDLHPGPALPHDLLLQQRRTHSLSVRER